MTRGRPRQQPTRRNLELYHERAYEGRLQIAVAARFQLSPPRAAKICDQVRAWVDQTLTVVSPTGRAASASPGLRLHLAIAVRRMQSTAAYGPQLDLLQGCDGIYKWLQWHAAVREGLVPPDVAGQLPPLGMLVESIGMLEELEDLASVAERGPFFHLPELAKESPPPGTIHAAAASPPGDQTLSRD
jgi:hypothetical protein